MTTLQSTEANRLSRLQRIGGTRNSVVISYLTSVRDGAGSMILDADNRILERHFEMALASGAKDIDLVLCTNGGQGEMGWNFHALFREYFPKGRLGVFVPHVAYSAGTQICLGCDEIIMGRSSVLGPIDTQAGNAFGGLLDLMNDFSAGKNDNGFDRVLAGSSAESALQLGRFYRMYKEDRRVIRNALESRRNPLADKENERILRYFHHEVGVHGQGVRRKEALAAGLSFIKHIEETNVEADIKSLFTDYATIMRLFDPFRGTEPNNEKAPMAMIESEFETNVAYVGGRSDRIWEPGQVPAEAESADASAFSSVTWTSDPRETVGTARPARRAATLLQRMTGDRS